MWVCASEEFEKKEIMVKMIKFLTHQNCNYLDPEQLQTCIRDELKSKKFLLVLDDVWSDDRYKWSELRDLLEEGDDGSKVIVTTRSASVARTVGTVSAHNLKGLPYEDCLSLFKKWAFNKGEEEHYPNRMENGKDIVKKCGGLPLAVRTLATLLYERNEDHYWKFIRENEVWELEQKEGDILPTLKLSYDQMKSHLKPCFAICSIFPKDYEFSSYWLPRVWMAHGLLQSSDEGQELEDIGVQYIKELYSKSFFQDFIDHGDFFVFKMHDLVHDLALSVAQGECSMVTVRSKNISEGIRQMSFFDQALLDKKIPEFLRKSSHLRTILFQSKAEGPTIQSFIFNFISSCKYLRMLDLAGSSFAVLPSSVGALKHLTYLNLSRNDRIKELPDSICNLHNLQSLCLGGCLRLEKLPRDMRSMIKLRCLVMTVKQKCLPADGIGSLKSLQFLSIEECSNLEFLLEGIQLLKSLRSLHISSCENLVSLPILKYSTMLQTLLIKDCKNLNLMGVEESGVLDLSLQSLILDKLPQLITLPEWLLGSSKTLQYLSIRSCVYLSTLRLWIKSFTVLKKIEIERCPRLFVTSGQLRRMAALALADVPQVSLNSMYPEDYINRVPDGR
ncbi:putative disease resistance protein RGA3 [Tripterygium wilfordii]|uniref:putative disease resistance protein RGA3 n=1 Tax=Tripterygium wilfordii TaxID=458696 RepID=UPI0018F803B8|nr:putative disease resistance protein RGA3 [Tripterygium wilfordii]XP_038687083.1 putative disease resistance protein RGA3 [Tripterygium wilfordii]